MSDELIVLLTLPIVWMGMCWILSRLGGWQCLAQHFGAKSPPAGQRYWIESGKVGCVTYYSCLTIHAGPDGLHLAACLPFRFGHPPLLIPWREVRDVGSIKIWPLGEWLKLEVGSPCIATLELSKKILTSQPAAA